MYMNVLSAYMYVHYVCAAPTEARRGHHIPSGTRVMDCCEPPYESWELNLGPRQEQQMLLAAEPSL